MNIGHDSATTAHTNEADPTGARAEWCAYPAPEAGEDRAERHLRLLKDLAEIGMNIARAVERQALERAAAEPAQAEPATDIGLTFQRVAKAIRQTVALEAKLAADRDEGLRRAAETEAARAEGRRRDARRARLYQRRRDVARAVRKAIDNTEYRDKEDLLADLAERLEDEDIEADLHDRPLSEIILQICKDLGIDGDWRLWEGEAWEHEEWEAKAAAWRAKQSAEAPPPPPESRGTVRWIFGAGIVRPPGDDPPLVIEGSSDPP
ncbi:MAG TPA: hypothetical protein VM689_10600 [Aliidongia sp.]|nr:hypothetical protein [Aliidongia sp.]